MLFDYLDNVLTIVLPHSYLKNKNFYGQALSLNLFCLYTA